MRLRTLTISAVVIASIAGCTTTPDFLSADTYPDYAAQASAIADYVLYRAIMRDLQCADRGDCAPTLNVNVRQQ